MSEFACDDERSVYFNDESSVIYPNFDVLLIRRRLLSKVR